ncbi:DNA polymerase I [Hazenella sp. IB182357]|uniref:DNA polymerase I n=1 Tax=Polycladospora coralii TaxID=2771432 RepID=A0A926RUT9_9BACL|nr:DNA polymerase I [Polycladospora coralii]MBD1372794.1 DNA polymerase I [Polycladospora coralii]
MGKLVLIDGNSILFRAFYALPLLSNSSGNFTNAVYGFSMMLMKVLEEEKPTHVLVAFDAGKTTFRHETYQEYKGGRQKTPSELSEQFPLVKEVLDAFGIRYFEKEQYEADDIIGTIANHPDTKPLDTRIVSGDKDLLQLVNETVHVLFPRKGVTEVDRYDISAIDEKYGLQPHQIIDLKGLMGDSSDNIPGIPGVGEKTALKLLNQFPSVEEIVAHPEELPGKKLREKVKEFQEQALMSKELATIFTEVPLSFKIGELVIGELYTDTVFDIFKKLEFNTLLDRIQKKKSKSTEEKNEQEITPVNLFQPGEPELKRWLNQTNLAFTVEASQENPHHAQMIGLAISDGEKQVYLSTENAKRSPAFVTWLADEKATKITYDAKKAKLLLHYSGFQVEGIEFDTLLAAYLLNPSEAGQEISDLMRRYDVGVIPPDEEVYGKGAKRVALEGEELASHLARKCHALYQLFPVIKDHLTQDQMDELLYELELPLTDVLAKMEQIGVKVDQERLNEMGTELKEKMDGLQAEIYELAGSTFNINSPKQLGVILFDKLGLPVLKKTKTGYSTSADVLEKLAPQHEIVDKILHYRQVGKLHSTYVEGLKKEILTDGKVHTRFNQTITATGRLSSTEPNLQNIPIRLEEGRKIRQIFIPSSAKWHILAADYSQVELRVLAHLSADDNLQAAFQQDMDIHTKTAMDVFGVQVEDVTSLMRRQAKAVNFGIVYGISDFGLSQNLNITRKEAKAFIDRYFETFPGVKGYMEKVVAQAKEDGYVKTLLGRKRYLPDLHSRNFNVRSFAERTAMNTPIQGTAADIIKRAMIQIATQLVDQQLESKMLLQVHDELIFEVPEGELAEMKTLVRSTMENTLPLSVPLKVDVSVGKSWYEAK